MFAPTYSEAYCRTARAKASLGGNRCRVEVVCRDEARHLSPKPKSCGQRRCRQVIQVLAGLWQKHRSPISPQSSQLSFSRESIGANKDTRTCWSRSLYPVSHAPGFEIATQ